MLIKLLLIKIVRPPLIIDMSHTKRRHWKLQINLISIISSYVRNVLLQMIFIILQKKIKSYVHYAFDFEWKKYEMNLLSLQLRIFPLFLN